MTQQNFNIFNQPSGYIRKKGDVIMSTKEMIKMFAVEVELDIKLGKHKGYALENPVELPQNIKMMIMDSFYPVALTAFNQNQCEAFQEDVFSHLFNVDCLILAFNDNVEYGNGNKSVERGIAFRTFSDFEVLGKKTAYVEGTAVDPNYQGMGFYQAFSKAYVNDSYAFVASRTQNPVVVTALSKIYGNVAPITDAPNEEYKEVGWVLAKRLNMQSKYDKDTMVGKGIYGKSLNGLKPRINSEISAKMYQKISVDDGDCIIAVCKN